VTLDQGSHAPSDAPSDDLVPISVRLGEVVPPEDPEDWTKPLTWVAAAGMLAAPVLALAWFSLAPPANAEPVVGTWLLAATVAGGAVLTGATQQGPARAWTATLAAALFSSLVVIVAGAVLAGQRQVGAASPSLAHAFAGGVAGLAGAAAASPIAARMASVRSRRARLAVPGAVAVGAAALVLPLLFGTG
jgi:hypothetical protein